MYETNMFGGPYSSGRHFSPPAILQVNTRQAQVFYQKGGGILGPVGLEKSSRWIYILMESQ